MRRRLAAGVVVLALTAVLAGCTSSATAQITGPEQVAGDLPVDTVAQMEAAASTAMAASGASGMLVGVWAPWSGEWVAGLGSTAPEGGVPVTTDMTFRAGELTRAMTCDALYRLAARGTVSLDDSVTEYVAAAPTLADVTLVDLCNSTSGVGSASDALSGSWLSNPTRQWDPRELTSYGIADADLDAIGTAYRSSDAGYMLLGTALERATGKRAAQILADEVFEPLGLSSTALPGAAPAAPVVGGTTALPGFAVGADCTTRTDATVMSASTGFTDSGVVTSLEDAATYVRALAFGALRPEGTPEPAAFQPYDGAPSWLRTVGGAYRAGTMVGQVGSVQGYTTAAFADEVSGLTVVVVLNASGGDGLDAAALAWQLAAIASKVAPNGGRAAPEAGLPWTAQQFGDEIVRSAICPVG